ncbi:MAG: NAD-dependent protein deacylase [Oscillospiraceae bacterium]|nr:NAD-dependent protein deacylase [Oscillospiraceae bacterium]
MQSNVEALREAVLSSENIVFFGGAGVSTESGIPDYRGPKGLYTQKNGRCTPPPSLNMRLFKDNPEDFYDYYRKNMLSWEAEPNAAHLKLAELEKQGKLKAVITQNIDGLHQAAGSRNVIELHGSMKSNHCIRCRKSYDISEIRATTGVPHCKICGGLIKPDVIFFGEKLDKSVINKATKCIRAADMLIVGGTSLVVNPAVSLIYEFKGRTLAIINLAQTGLDGRADIVIHDKIGKVLSAI